MGFKESKENRKSEEKGMQAIAQHLVERVEHCADVARGDVAVDTGDLKSTIRVSEPEISSNAIKVALQSGGVGKSGRVVNYAHEQEIENPFMWPAILEL